MFSTVDSPSARFLRVYLVMPDGKVAVAVPADIGHAYARVRALPSQERMDDLAQKLAAKTWAPRNYNDLAASPKCALPPVCYQRQPECASPLPPVYRALGSKEPLPPPHERVAFVALHVELWKSRFDLTQHRLHAFRLLEASAPSPVEEPPAQKETG